MVRRREIPGPSAHCSGLTVWHVQAQFVDYAPHAESRDEMKCEMKFYGRVNYQVTLRLYFIMLRQLALERD